MQRARKTILFVVMLGSLLGTFAADTEGFQREKSPPEVGLMTRMRRQEDAKKQQAQNDVTLTVPDIDAVERQLDGLNNTVSNAMHLADETRRADEANTGVFESVVIAAAILGIGIFMFRKFAPRIGSWLYVPRVATEDTSSALAEEKSFADFVAAFKVGPTQRRRYSSETASDSARGEPLPVAAPGPLKTFFDNAPKAVAVMRSLIQEITRAGDQAARQKLLVNLCEKVHDLKCIAGLPEVLPVWQLAAALEGLVKQLSDKDRNVTPSTLRTVASAVDLFESLSVSGIKSDLASNPPIRFLAVDDDALSRHAVSFALKKALNKPDLAENGEAALALVSHIKYDAVFLDVQMPGMDGFETCSKIHRAELNRATPVVFVTCQSDFDSRAKSTLSGGIDLIGKPFLTFEITVKALTLALRGRLKPQTGTNSQPENPANAKELAKPSDEKETQLLIEKEPANGAGNAADQPVSRAEPKHSNEGQSTSSRKSREARRRDRRRKAQAIRETRNPSSRRERSNNEAMKDEVAGGESIKADVPGESAGSPSDLVANAFLAHAPENIETLQDRVEQICQEPNDEARQELLVELYLAIHSLAAEAHLAKLETIFQLSSAVEGLLKKLLEEPKGSVISSLSIVANTLELLHDFCDAKLISNLTEESIRVLVLAGDPLARKNVQDTIQLPSAKIENAETSEALKLAAEKHFDLFVFDVLTPNTDTFSLCAKLREQGKGKTPIVFVSDDPSLELLLESTRSSNDRLLQRSSSPAEVSLAALTSALAGRFEQLMPHEASDELHSDAPVDELAAAK